MNSYNSANEEFLRNQISIGRCNEPLLKWAYFFLHQDSGDNVDVNQRVIYLRWRLYFKQFPLFVLFYPVLLIINQP